MLLEWSGFCAQTGERGEGAVGSERVQPQPKVADRMRVAIHVNCRAKGLEGSGQSLFVVMGGEEPFGHDIWSCFQRLCDGFAVSGTDELKFVPSVIMVVQILKDAASHHAGISPGMGWMP